jgi:hypothetical protein
MRRLMRFGLAAGLLLAGLAGPSPAALAQTAGPDGTPQVEASSERLSYGEGALPELLTHYWIVMSGVDSLPQYPSPQEAKDTDVRKRILDLRLIMDLNAFAFEPGQFEAYRDAIDAAYEKVGEFKDLFDIQAITTEPIDPVFLTGRLAKMNVALAPFRFQGFREDLKNFFYNRAPHPLTLEFKSQPRLWQIAKLTASDGYDSAGNAALLGANVLWNLKQTGLLVDDITNPEQEAQFHDVRKALRSVLVLSDMFPTLTAAVSQARDPLSKVVKAYGKTNDQFVAYHEAQLAGRNLDQRIKELRASYDITRDLANQFANSSQLDDFASALHNAGETHRR